MGGSGPAKQEYDLISDDPEIQAIQIIMECLQRRRDDNDKITSEEKQRDLRILRYCILRIEGYPVDNGLKQSGRVG